MGKINIQGILELVDAKINSAVFQKISRATANLPKSLQATAAASNQLNTNMGRVNRTIQGTAQQLTVADKVAKKFVQRLAQFAVSLPIFQRLNRAIQGSVSFLADF